MPLFATDAVALEEDTYLVLSTDREVRDPCEPLMKIMTRVLETRRETPGSVPVRGGRPLRLLAVLLDLNRKPFWKEEWMETGLQFWAFPP